MSDDELSLNAALDGLPVPSSVSQRTKLEMERGRVIAGRKQRESDLDRLRAARKVTTSPMVNGIMAFWVDGVKVCDQHIGDDDYPSEYVMATLQLAVAATLGFDGVPSEEHGITPEERAHRDAYRRQYVRRPQE